MNVCVCICIYIYVYIYIVCMHINQTVECVLIQIVLFMVLCMHFLKKIVIISFNLTYL